MVAPHVKRRRAAAAAVARKEKKDKLKKEIPEVARAAPAVAPVPQVAVKPPEEVPEVASDRSPELSKLKKGELIALATERELITTGLTKSQLVDLLKN
jgi:hypothetical protein